MYLKTAMIFTYYLLFIITYSVSCQETEHNKNQRPCKKGKTNPKKASIESLGMRMFKTKCLFKN